MGGEEVLRGSRGSDWLDAGNACVLGLHLLLHDRIDWSLKKGLILHALVLWLIDALSDILLILDDLWHRLDTVIKSSLLRSILRLKLLHRLIRDRLLLHHGVVGNDLHRLLLLLHH